MTFTLASVPGTIKHPNAFQGATPWTFRIYPAFR